MHAHCRKTEVWQTKHTLHRVSKAALNLDMTASLAGTSCSTQCTLPALEERLGAALKGRLGPGLEGRLGSALERQPGTALEGWLGIEGWPGPGLEGQLGPAFDRGLGPGLEGSLG